MMTAADAASEGAKTQADQGWDTYQERVLRNEGRLEGLEQLVKETRQADAKLVEQRSNSLAKELSDTAESLRHLMAEQRAADKEEFRAELGAAKELADAYRLEQNRRRDENMAAMQDLYHTAVEKNYEQSNAQIKATDERSDARNAALRQQVHAWRESDREARDLQAQEYARRLDVLNHANVRQMEFQNASVTRELWDAEHRGMSEKINVVERAILQMPTNAQSDKINGAIHLRIEEMSRALAATQGARDQVLNDKISELRERLLVTDQQVQNRVPIDTNDKQRFETVKGIDAAIASATSVLDTKMGVMAGQILDLKEVQTRQAGKAIGASTMWAALLAGVGLLITVIIAANAIFGK